MKTNQWPAQEPTQPHLQPNPWGGCRGRRLNQEDGVGSQKCLKDVELLPWSVRAVQAVNEGNTYPSKMSIQDFKHGLRNHAISTRVAHKDIHFIFPVQNSIQTPRSATTRTAYSHIEWLIAQSNTLR